MAKNDLVAVILAAGSSSRLGQPKQELLYKGKTLLQNAIEKAKLLAGHVVVVLGANYEHLKNTIEQEQVIAVQNKDWTSGMSSSIRTAVAALKSAGIAYDFILFMTCDQPLIPVHFLQELYTLTGKSDKHIFAAGYRQTQGVPVIFSREYIPRLMNLKGDEGARKILQANPHDLLILPCEEAGIDIDTPADIKHLNNSFNYEA